MSKQRGASCRRMTGGSRTWTGRPSRRCFLNQIEIGRAARRRAGDDVAGAGSLQQFYRAGDVGRQPQRRGDVEIDEDIRRISGMGDRLFETMAYRGQFWGRYRLPSTSGRLTAISAPAFKAACSSRSESLLNAMASKSPVCLACSMVQASRGLPNSSRAFLPTTPLEPPRAHIVQNDLMPIPTCATAVRVRWRRSDP